MYTQEEAKAAREAAKLKAMQTSAGISAGGKSLTPAQQAVAKIKEGDSLAADGKEKEALVKYKEALVRVGPLHKCCAGLILLFVTRTITGILRRNSVANVRNWSRKSPNWVSLANRSATGLVCALTHALISVAEAKISAAEA